MRTLEEELRYLELIENTRVYGTLKFDAFLRGDPKQICVHHIAHTNANRLGIAMGPSREQRERAIAFIDQSLEVSAPAYDIAQELVRKSTEACSQPKIAVQLAIDVQTLASFDMLTDLKFACEMRSEIQHWLWKLLIESELLVNGTRFEIFDKTLREIEHNLIGTIVQFVFDRDTNTLRALDKEFKHHCRRDRWWTYPAYLFERAIPTKKIGEYTLNEMVDLMKYHIDDSRHRIHHD